MTWARGRSQSQIEREAKDATQQRSRDEERQDMGPHPVCIVLMSILKLYELVNDRRALKDLIGAQEGMS